VASEWYRRVFMQCVVLAGGLGTRMRPMTETVPKSLLPVAGLPFVDWQLRWLAAHGVTNAVLCIGQFGEMIEEHVGDGARFGLPVRYVREGQELRGTAGALRLALEEGALEDEFLVTYGDSYLRVDFGAVGKAFRDSGKPALMTVFLNAGEWDTSNVVFDAEKRLVALYDKRRALRPAGDYRYIDYGLTAYRRDTIERLVPSGQRYDLAEVLHGLSLEGDLAGLEVFERYYEIGSPSGLSDLERYLASA
jgi:NDP-sugar pyrophosphorylase family protein